MQRDPSRLKRLTSEPLDWPKKAKQVLTSRSELPGPKCRPWGAKLQVLLRAILGARLGSDVPRAKRLPRFECFSLACRGNGPLPETTCVLGAFKKESPLKVPRAPASVDRLACPTDPIYSQAITMQKRVRETGPNTEADPPVGPTGFGSFRVSSSHLHLIQTQKERPSNHPPKQNMVNPPFATQNRKPPTPPTPPNHPNRFPPKTPTPPTPPRQRDHRKPLQPSAWRVAKSLEPSTAPSSSARTQAAPYHLGRRAARRGEANWRVRDTGNEKRRLVYFFFLRVPVERLGLKGNRIRKPMNLTVQVNLFLVVWIGAREMRGLRHGMKE